jgi:hypothetical protein
MESPCTKTVLPTSSLYHTHLCYRRSVFMCADAKLAVATAPRSRRDNSAPSHAARRRLGVRRFASGIQTRALARFLSRWFTRAKSSVLLSGRWAFLPETVTRVETSLSHRKQRVGYASTRNVPAHGFAPLFRDFRAPGGLQRLALGGGRRAVGQEAGTMLICCVILPDTCGGPS